MTRPAAPPDQAAADGGPGPPGTAVGGALFLVSDTLLALDKFGHLHLPTRAW